MALLHWEADSLGINLSDDQLTKFETYYARLVAWNKRCNLTSVTDYEAIQTRHFLDSLSIILADGDLNHKTIIDVGAGAGFPGLPLKIVFPDMCLTLLEATGKKTEFLSHLCDELDLKSVTVINDRAENVAHNAGHREKYDLSVSRAVASLDTLCELCLPFCRTGGNFIAMKRQADLELTSADQAMSVLGGQLRQRIAVKSNALPDGSELLVIEKTKSTPSGFPRRNGIPGKRPL
ncbi:MAG: 16S rRNA (guanine(527)-N(7))-methyltransferase RsmG [Dehalogenimonas sp.]|uniref:Ribosomal RNA small subunit methyltransferase G n=1 Tax=Candidatus Dehalogenimonas loeffleri TaxID=3127115 RepID=A0ABZ2J705_9CHLR|nr:16S rRNA (guanine(527)-N(7))-methyltransferase RsmG [Dehalogenimonas sp.]